jgi:hypothetical protein
LRLTSFLLTEFKDIDVSIFYSKGHWSRWFQWINFLVVVLAEWELGLGVWFHLSIILNLDHALHIDCIYVITSIMVMIFADICYFFNAIPPMV